MLEAVSVDDRRARPVTAPPPHLSGCATSEKGRILVVTVLGFLIVLTSMPLLLLVAGPFIFRERQLSQAEQLDVDIRARSR